MRISVQIRSNHLPTLAARVPDRAHEALSASMLRVRDGAARRSRVDTGALRDSWSVSFTGPTDGQVASSAAHAVFNEWGTISMPAQPMLAPAIDEERPKFVAALAKIVSDLG